MDQKSFELTPIWDGGRLNCPECPRHKWEGDVEYYQRLARFSTTINGIAQRNANVNKAYESGQPIREIAIDYGISSVAIRNILRKAGGSYKVRPPVPEGRDEEIFKRIAQGESYASIGRAYGITGGRVRDIWGNEQRRIWLEGFRARTKEAPHGEEA
jgi:DNA invertase Pin-like site-specific DNA recombinase